MDVIIIYEQGPFGKLGNADKNVARCFPWKTLSLPRYSPTFLRIDFNQVLHGCG